MNTTNKKQVKIIGDPSQSTWSLQRNGPGSAHVYTKNNSALIGWPTMSQIIYPGSTGRINTGINSTQIGNNVSLTTYPMKTLLQNGLMSFPEVIDVTDPRNGGQISQLVQNTNKFPVRIQYETPTQLTLNEDGDMPGPRITRLDPDTLEPIEILQDFDWGALLNGVVQVGVKLLPLLL